MSTLQVLVISLLIAASATDGMQQVSRRTFANWKALRGLLARNSVPNATPRCRKPIDIGIAMDRSLRNTATGWSDIMQFVRTLVSNFDISIDMTHIGAISFDLTADVLLKFNDLLDYDNILEAVHRAMDTWRSGVHAENTGIDQAMSLSLTNLFTDRDGARGYDEVLVLLTYGRQNSESAAVEARMLEEQGVKIVVVGIGEADPIELWNIAGALTDPAKFENVFYMKDRNAVSSLAEQVAKAVCNLFESVHV